MKTTTELTVLSNDQIATGVFSMELQYPEDCVPQNVKPGQFVGVYLHDPARLLPRPISICGWDEERGVLRLVYRVVGAGTGEMSSMKPGESVRVLGILGNGYDVDSLTGKKVLLMGGGIGAPPLLELAKQIRRKDPSAQITAVLGYRTADLFLADEFRACADVIIATDDGSAGFHGNVVDAVRSRDIAFDVICACGPMPMLRGVKALAQEQSAGDAGASPAEGSTGAAFGEAGRADCPSGENKGVQCWLSLEERMACGVGACLGCVTKTKNIDDHSKVHNARICTEGPVFNAEDVLI